LRCACRRRGRHPVQVVLLRLVLKACMAFCVHLTQPKLSERLVDLLSELVWQIGTRVLVRYSAHVDEQPGISPPQFDLGGIEEGEHDITDDLLGGKRAHALDILADVLLRRRPVVIAAAQPRRIHDSEPPNRASRGPTISLDGHAELRSHYKDPGLAG
jgi:hypothetical protein